MDEIELQAEVFRIVRVMQDRPTQGNQGTPTG